MDAIIERKKAMKLVSRDEMVEFIKSKSSSSVKAAFANYTGDLPWAYWLYKYTFDNKGI